MTIETTDGSGDPVLVSGPYNGDGATSSFDYDFQIQAEDELLVTRQNADGTETVLTLTTQYTVSGVDSDTGGSITLVDAATDLPTGTKMVISYDGQYDQTTEYSNQGRIQLNLLEKSLDKLTMHLRSVKELVDRSVKVSSFSDADLATLQANIQALADIESDVAAVAAIVSDVTSVAAIDTDVTAVAGVSTEVAALEAIDAEIVSLEAIKAAISSVAAIDDDVTTVAANVADITNFADVYYGPAASDPATRPDGSATQTGDMYFNTTDGYQKIYDGADWDPVPASLLGLGTASTKDTGTTDGTIPLLTTGGKLPNARLPVQDEADWEAGTETEESAVSPVKMKAAIDANAGVKAWVNFDGTGTVSIRESSNVSSITDNGTGDFTINLANALVDANYAAVATTTISATGNSDIRGANANAIRDQTTTSFRLFCMAVTNTTSLQDPENACVIVTR